MGDKVVDSNNRGIAVGAPRVTGLEPLKKALNAESVRQQFDNALKENSGPFVASILELVSSDKGLQECDPNLIVIECLKAATLKLPINKQLGQAWIIARKEKGVKKPRFQMGYKGWIQLAMRTGKYRFLNAGSVYEGITVDTDLLTGKVVFNGKATSIKPQGYFAHMELLNGFTKTVYMTTQEVHDHAKQYSPSYAYEDSAWKTNFNEMATKTQITDLLSHYGYVSIEMIKAMSSDDDNNLQQEKAENANKEIIDVPAKAADCGGAPAAEKEAGPGF